MTGKLISPFRAVKIEYIWFILLAIVRALTQNILPEGKDTGRYIRISMGRYSTEVNNMPNPFQE
jgi:hypothetical protein